MTPHPDKSEGERFLVALNIPAAFGSVTPVAVGSPAQKSGNRPWSLSPRATTGSGYGKLSVLHRRHPCGYHRCTIKGVAS